VAAVPLKQPIDTGSDAGNYLGGCHYVEGQELVRVSEMEAVGTGIAVNGVFMQRCNGMRGMELTIFLARLPGQSPGRLGISSATFEAGQLVRAEKARSTPP
jgi:hypothetical protein